MSPLPSISILVMSYNQEAFISECVSSVLSQKYDGRLEFIFCDDNSSDHTYDIIKELVCKYTGPHRVVTFQSDSNVRVAANMNNGISLSTCEWIMRMDGDDIMHPDRVRITATAIQKYPDAYAICGRYKTFSSQAEQYYNVSDDELIYHVSDYSMFSKFSKPDELEWWGGIMCMRKEVFTHFGPLPCECATLDDTMFATRSLMLGQFVSMPNAIMIYYRRHTNNVSSETNSPKNLFDFVVHDRNMRSYYRKGIICHEPILKELRSHVQAHPEFQGLLDYFEYNCAEMKRQGEFWSKPWKDRIDDAQIKGPFWKKIPWAIRVMNPWTYALISIFKKKS